MSEVSSLSDRCTGRQQAANYRFINHMHYSSEQGYSLPFGILNVVWIYNSAASQSYMSTVQSILRR